MFASPPKCRPASNDPTASIPKSLHVANQAIAILAVQLHYSPVFFLDPKIKSDPVRRWQLPDRIFFGHGACHILAGVYLANPPMAGFFAERILPSRGLLGNHIYVTDGVIAFDYRGYTVRNKMLRYHKKNWSRTAENWSCIVEKVQFDLLDTNSLNRRKMKGPNQYFGDPLERSKRFIRGINHRESFRKASMTMCV